MTPSPGSECPSTAELELFLSEPGRDERIAQHLETCSRCREALEEIRVNNELMARFVGSTRALEEVERPKGPPPPSRLVPAIAGYEIHEEIHRGGQGIVYRATQRATKRHVALKVLLAGTLATSRQRRRFEREIELVAQLQHPNIVTVYDSGKTRDGCHYFAMQYVEGVPLDEYVRSARDQPVPGDRQSVKNLLRLFLKICEGITYAHQRGVIHRDLKPSNICIDANGDPHILDFGLAKTLDTDAAQSLLTAPDTFLGTLAYASPEQTQGVPVLVDTRTDVYSLGVILYEMLTGHFPYPVVGAVAEVLKNIADVEPERPSSWYRRETRSGVSAHSVSLSHKVDAELETIILKALAKEPARRYQSAEELRRDVEHYLRGEPVLARPPSVTYQLRKFAQRNKTLVGGVAAVFVVLVLGVIGTSIGLARAVVAREGEAEQRQIAESERDRARKAEALARQRLAEAVEARGAEAEGRKRAEAEAAKARAVNQFLQEMLAAAKPEKTLGRELSVGEVLDGAAKTIDEGLFVDQPDVEGAVRSTIGLTYVSLGLYAAAEPHLREALELHRRLHGDEHENVASSLNNLALLYDKWGRYEEAEPLHVEALEISRRTRGEEHPGTLIGMDNLAVLYQGQGRYDEAEALFVTALETRRRVLGTEDPTTLSTMTNLAWLRCRQGRYEEAEALFTEALDARRRVLGAEHPHTLISMGNLAGLYLQQGRYEQAEELYATTLGAMHRVFGDEHPETLASMSNLAQLYVGQGRYAEAEQILEEVLTVLSRVLGDEHPNTLTVVDNLGQVYCRQGRFAEAEPLLTKVLDVRRRVLGPDHPDTLNSMNSLAWLRRKQGRHDEAEPLLVEALEVRRRVLGGEHPRTLGSMNNLATLYRDQGRHDEGEALCVAGLSVSRRVLGDEHPQTLRLLYGLANCLVKAERFDEAETTAKGCFERYEAVFGPEDSKTLKAVGLLIELYEAWGKPEQAAEWRAKLSTTQPASGRSMSPPPTSGRSVASGGGHPPLS